MLKSFHIVKRLNPKNKRNKEKALNFAYSDLLETGRKEFLPLCQRKKA